MKWIDKLEPAAVLDAAKFVASGAVATGAEVVAGYTGAVVGAVTGDADKAGNAVRSTKEWLNWTPEYSSDTAAQLGEVVGPAAESFGRSSEKVADRSGRWAMEATGSAAVGALVKGGIRVVPELRGKWFHDAPKNKMVDAVTDPDKIVEAESLAFNGKSPEYITAKTGMWKAPDGKWREWISDKDAKLNKDAIPKGALAGKSIETTVGKFLDHPELYKKHPDAGDIKVVVTVDPDLDSIGHGFFKPEENTIYLFQRSMNGRQVESNLLHEVQHFVQAKGELVGGYNDDVAKLLIKDTGLEKTVSKLRKLETKFAKEGNVAELKNVQTALMGLDPQSRYKYNLGEVEARLTGDNKEKYAGASPILMAELARRNSLDRGVNVAKLDEESVKYNKDTLTADDIISSVPSIRDNPDVLKYVKGEQE